MLTREFTLQPALAHKQRLEEICQMELAEIEVAYEHERSVLDLLCQLERLGYQELEHRQELGDLHIDAIRMCLDDLQTLQRRIEEQAGVLQYLAEKARLKREELIELSKQKKALEKLRERHFKEIAQAESKAENKVLDDIATSQYHRRRNGEALP